MSPKRLRIGSLAVVTVLLLSVFAGGSAGAAPAACDGAAQKGCWSKPFSPFGEFDAATPQTPQQSTKYPTAATVVMLPTGRILYWNGLQNLEDARAPLPVDAAGQAESSKTAVLDLTQPGAPLFFVDAVAPKGDDLFCTDQRLTQSGDLVAVGGTHWESEISTGPVGDAGGPRGLAELYGSKQQHVLQAVNALPQTDTVGSATQWNDPTVDPTMNFGRWYPTMVTLPDSRLFVAGGVAKLLWNSKALDDVDQDDTDQAPDNLPHNVNETEIRNADGSWVLNGENANVSLPLFARILLAPSGHLIYTGAGQMWGPAGEAADQTEWNNIRALDATSFKADGSAAGEWKDLGMPEFGARSGAFATMLPLKPPYDSADILVAGGVLGTSPGTYVATNLAEKITVGADAEGNPTASTDRVGDLTSRRWFSTGVLLPNGQVLAVNGADADEVIMPGPERSVRQAEIFDPATNRWTALSSGSRDRTYHNSAMLLPDGSVLIGGHAPINQYYGDKGTPQAQPGGVNGFKDPSFERFFPPYLFNGTRPSISTAQSHATWGDDLQITLDPSAPAPAKIVLSRLPSVTHITDADMRAVELPFTQTGESVSAAVPSSRSVLPPGYYYVFALGSEGTPSVATIVQVADPTNYDTRPSNAVPVEMQADWQAAGTVSAAQVRDAAGGHVPGSAIAAQTAGKAAASAPLSAPATDRGSEAWAFVLVALAIAAGVRRIFAARPEE